MDGSSTNQLLMFRPGHTGTPACAVTLWWALVEVKFTLKINGRSWLAFVILYCRFQARSMFASQMSFDRGRFLATTGPAPVTLIRTVQMMPVRRYSRSNPEVALNAVGTYTPAALATCNVSE